MIFWRSGIFRWLVVSFTIYWIVAAYFWITGHPFPDAIKTGIDAAGLMLGLAIAMTWFHAAVRAFRTGGSERKWKGVFGVFLVPAFWAALRAWSIYGRESHYPADWLMNPVSGALVGGMVAGLYAIYSAGAAPELETPQASYRWSLAAIGAAGLIVGWLVAHAPV